MMTAAILHHGEADPDELLVFADEDRTGGLGRRNPWQVLIVDDDEDTHRLTRFVLGDLTFRDRPVSFLSAYSAAEARARLHDNPEVAVILLDVDAGLQLVSTIREQLGNRRVRIVLRAGRPEEAPAVDVLARYDINIYRNKHDLTAHQLQEALLVSLRDFNDIRSAERSREGMQTILASAGSLFGHDRLETLAETALDGLVSMLAGATGSRGVRGLVATEIDGAFRVGALRRWHDRFLGEPAAAVLPAIVARMLPRVLGGGAGVFCPGGYVDVLVADDAPRHLVYVAWDRLGGESERDLIRVLMANATLAYRNLSLRREIVETQKEVITTLSEVVETRCSETANHVLRVGLLAARLAVLYGLPAAEVEVLRTVAPMHDVGKVGVPDAVLLKPGTLDDDERRLIQTHTTVGHCILSRSERRLMQAAAIVALQHHERWDGDGYPHGRCGEEIHVHARITALVDVFDALLQARIYRPALPVDKVRDMIAAQRGRAFEPRLVDLLLADLDQFLAIREAHPDPAPGQSETSSTGRSSAAET